MKLFLQLWTELLGYNKWSIRTLNSSKNCNRKFLTDILQENICNPLHIPIISCIPTPSHETKNSRQKLLETFSQESKSNGMNIYFIKIRLEWKIKKHSLLKITKLKSYLIKPFHLFGKRSHSCLLYLKQALNLKKTAALQSTGIDL